MAPRKVLLRVVQMLLSRYKRPLKGAMTQRTLSLAAVRRLAHDAQQKLTKSGYDSAIESLDDFLVRALKLSAQAAEFSRRKVISHEHVSYAVVSMGLALPPELRGALAEDYKQLKRCNIRAPAEQRKQTALYAEIPEAAFSRFLKASAARARITFRIKATARRFLQLVAEQRVLAHFLRSQESPETINDASTARALGAVLGCSTRDGDALTLFLTRLLNRAPLLMRMSRTQTISGRLVRAAAEDLPWPPIADYPNETAADLSPTVAPMNEKLLRVCHRILRGRVPDKRVTSAAVTELACFFQRYAASSISLVQSSREARTAL